MSDSDSSAAGSPDVGRSTAVMAAGTGVSRVLGLVRASVLVTAVGVNVLGADAFAIANTLPNVLYMLIAGGVLNAVLVPQVVRAYRQPGGQAYVNRLLTVGGALLLGVTVLLTAAAPLVVRIYAGSGSAELIALAGTFALWCLPQVFFYGVYTLLGQVLNARGSFGPYMWAPAVNNVIAITGLIVFITVFGEHVQGTETGTYAVWDAGRIALLAGTATLGVVGQALVLVIPLYRSGFRYRPRWGWRGAGLSSAGRVAGWTFAALVVGQLSIVVVQQVAARAAADSGPGVPGNNAYNLAFLIFMLPHSLITVSLVTALFTRLSNHAAAGDRSAVRADFSYGARTTGVFTIFASAVLAVLALPLTRLALPGSSPVEAASLSPVIVAMTAGLTALGLWSLVQRVYYAYEDARSLFWVQVPMAGVVAVGALAGALLLENRWWVPAAGAAIALQYVVGAAWGVVRLRRRFGGTGARTLRVYARAGVATLVATGVGWPLSHLFGDLSRAGWLTALAVCALTGLVMLGIYLGLLRLMRVSELQDLVAPLVGRLGRTMSTPGDEGAEGPDGRLAQPHTSRTARGHRGNGRNGGNTLDTVVIGHGTLLAGRYRLDQPERTDLPGVERWTARDQILDRPVRALVLREGRITQAQDGARRAALVNDPRLLRILDVGDHQGVPYTVTEPPTGRDLAQLTARGPLPADQARAIIGEAAVALEVARRRGVHHLALRPSAIHVTPEGDVVVSGLGMDGELAGHGLGDARSTTRADTVGLVALLYLTLTGRWPAPADTDPGDVPVAPQVAGSPVAPAELSPAVPNDLDTLCAVTLGPHDDGPHSPAELVRELEPWGPIAAEEIFGALDAAASWSAAAAGPFFPPVHEPAPEVDAAPSETDADRPGPEDEAPDDASPGGGSPGDQEADAGPADTSASAATVERYSVRTTFAEQPSTQPRPGTPPPAIPPAFHRSRPDAAPTAPEPAVPSAAATPVSRPPAPSSSETPVPSNPPSVPPHRGTDRPPGRETAPRDRTDERPAVLPGQDQEEFDSLIGRSAAALTRRRFDPTTLVLLLVTVGVVIGLVMAYNALTAPAPPIGGSDGFGDITDEVEEPAATPSEPADGEEGQDDDGEEEPSPTQEPPPEPVIVSGQQLDPPPDGDENEHPEAVDRALDGDSSTFWYTRTYVSPTYGMKDGVGYAVTLEEATTVSSVMLDVNGDGGEVEIRATDPSTPTDGDVLASGSLGPDQEYEFDEPVEAEHIVLWFTELPQTPEGLNRVELREMSVS